MMNDKLSGAETLGIIASAFERMNGFARSLWQDKRLPKASVSEHIGRCASGWMVAKYVEVPLNVELGYVATWAIELSCGDEAWHVVTSTSIAYGDYDKEVDVFNARDLAELEKRLEEATTNLIATMVSGADFRREVERLLC